MNHTSSPKVGQASKSRLDAAARVDTENSGASDEGHQLMFAVLLHRSTAIQTAKITWEAGDVEGAVALLRQAADPYVASAVIEAAMTRLSNCIEQFPSTFLFSSEMDMIETNIVPVLSLVISLLGSNSETVIRSAITSLTVALNLCRPTLTATATGSASKRKQQQLLSFFAAADAPLMACYSQSKKEDSLHGESKALLRTIRKHTRGA